MTPKQYRNLYKKTFGEDFPGTDIQIEKAAARRTSGETVDADTPDAVIEGLHRWRWNADYDDFGTGRGDMHAG